MGIIEEVIDDVLVEIINIERATIREAEYLKEKITPKINAGYIKVIVDLSAVEFLDSTFLGVIVGTLKKVVKQGGDLKLPCLNLQDSSAFLKHIRNYKTQLKVFINRDTILEI